MRRLIPQVLLDEPQFRLLFLGQALSVVGDRVTMVALPFAVLAAGGSATQVGLVAGAQFLPFLIFGLMAGVVADRTDRKRVLIASDLVRLVCQAAAGTLLVTGHAEVWHLAVIAFAYGAADAFFSPAFTGLLPQTLAEARHIQPANAMRALSYSVGSVAGPALAGLLIAIGGPGEALLADAATFAVSIALLVRLRPAVAERDALDEPRFLDGLRGGWREVRSRSWVLAFLAGMSVYHAIVLPSVFVLGPVLSEEELGGATSWAVIVAVFGAGSIIGDALLLRWRPRRALRTAAICLAVASCQAVIIGSGLPLLWIAVLEFGAAIFVSSFFTLWETSLQEHIPEHAISRVSSYDYVASTGLIPLGTVIAGPVSEAAGLRPTMIAMSAIGVLFSLSLLLVPAVRTLGRPPDARETASPAS
jgi:MFS family permease